MGDRFRSAFEKAYLAVWKLEGVAVPLGAFGPEMSEKEQRTFWEDRRNRLEGGCHCPPKATLVAKTVRDDDFTFPL